ncbi:protocadherin gamma-A5-like [Haemorhous mexicanus]|nr:protocadherin gamma-A5-like [Haemorhous mexicanus]
MAVRRRQRRGPGGGRALLAALLLLLLGVWGRAAAERVRYAIPEELGRGSLVGPLARDLGLSADELPARKLRLSEEKQYFTVNEENGNLYVNERLDREEMCGQSATCSISFEALVHNPLNIFHVEVAIEDVNDNSPVFRKAALDLEIGEWIPPGTGFPLEVAHDADVGSNSLLTYQLTSNPSFSLAMKESSDGSKPEIILERALDREKQSSFELVLTAVDAGDPVRSGTVQIRINVTDANDNRPVFSQDRYRVSLREDLPPGSAVLNLSASDADAGTNARITYSFGEMPHKALQKFVLHPESGSVTLQEALDFEETSTYSLAVEAKDGGGLVAHSKVEVEVLDVNDNPPEITILSLSSPVPEDAPVGTVVALLKVRDRDSGENGKVSCELSGEAPLSIVASSGGSYKVVTASALDREQASEHRVTVVARDRGRPSLWSSTELVLEVSDVNDNAPEFEEAAYSAYVAENNAAGALVLRVQARDADAGANGRVSYWLAGGSAGAAGAAPLVSVEARSGALYAQRSLDYEQCREFTVAVRAQDGGSPARSSTATVRVFVLDRNDNAPRVLWPAAAAAAAAGEAPGGAAATPFEVVPRSAEAGYLVAKVVAVDADAGRNAWLSYELVQASEPALFRVGLHSGEVRTARAVGERDAAKQRVVAVVKDHGQPALSATATLHVVLAESLQEALPELSERPAGAEAAEAAAELQFYLVLALALLSALLVLSVALAVLARLRRAGPPAVLRCLGAQRFSLAGAAFPADFCEGTLPYSYNLCVAAPARAVPEAAWPPPPPVPILSAEELLGGDSCGKPSPNNDLVVGEAPANPDAPQAWRAALGSARCLQCREEAAGAAVDREEREEARSATGSPARCGSAHSVARSLSEPAASDRPRVDRRCCGAGGSAVEMCAAGRRWGRRQRVLLWAVLLAAWEAAWGQLRYSVPEEMPKGSFVGDVAKDLGLQLPEIRDRGVHILEKGRTQYFALHGKTGHLVTAERIDREQLCESVQQCVLRCELIAEGEMQVYGIEVEITDINDNPPSFREAEKELRMSETTAPGSRFPLAEAHDPDSGRNSLQSYELSGDEHFSLAVQAGPGGDQRPELVLAKALDREEAAFHELVLRASDGGDPARTGTARIRVTVVDANDNAPVFSQAEYTVRVPEDVPVGSVLVNVTASDADEGPNGLMKYSIQKIKEKASQIFRLDGDTGAITLLRSLDFEEGNSYELEVQAHDGGGLSDTAKVVVTVTDVNDNAPELTVSSALSEISEDAPSGTVVALLHVQDRDSGEKGEVRCSLDGGVPFRLEKSFGDYYRVVTARELDREQVSEYNVTVRAADGGSPSLQSSAVLALRVLDVNDNAPVFAEERYSARLAENNAAGALVLTVRATDADWGQNARVRYRLAEGRVRGAPLSSYVSVQAETGALYALRSLDYEQLRELQLWVRAEDGGAPALSSNVSVRLQIVDENDNAPQVLYPPPAAAAAGSGSGSVAAWSGVELAPRRSEAGALVAKVVAVDADAGQNAWLSYELAKATEPGLFRVGLHSGEVRTARSPLARDAARHSLVVLVRDHGRPALSATATLSVVLAESVAELLAELGSAADEAAAPAEPAAGLTRWLVLAVAAVSCLFVAFLLLLLALRLRRWHRRQLLPPDSGALRGVPVSHFVGIDGVRAFLQSYSHDVSLTADSRKSQLRFSAASSCDTLPARPLPDEPAPLLGGEDPAGALPVDPAPPSQAQPNTDWRFSQTQRPGTSGSQNGEEAGAWPNNQFDTEMLQAMILASANEAADSNSTLGGGNGTMGLSARYGPQFTLQHVPDYRQNVYIPGSNATLTNAAGKRDAKNAAPAGGNKKKSGKKEKK